MFRTLTIAAFLLVVALPVSAGFKEGMAALKRGDYRTAHREFRPLAETGDAASQYALGAMYDNGLGIPKNYREAVKWYRKAALQGYSYAQYNLGVMYDNGHGGVPKSYREAVKWYRKAAVQGHAIAQHNLGVRYGNGQGVSKNYVLAYMWTSLAASTGVKRAAKNLEVFEKRMTPAQIAKAQEMAAKWKPKKAKSAK